MMIAVQRLEFQRGDLSVGAAGWAFQPDRVAPGGAAPAPHPASGARLDAGARLWLDQVVAGSQIVAKPPLLKFVECAIMGLCGVVAVYIAL